MFKSPGNEFLSMQKQQEYEKILFKKKKKYKKKYIITSPANEFLLHKCRIFFFLNLKKFTSPANEFLLHKCRNRKFKK